LAFFQSVSELITLVWFVPFWANPEGAATTIDPAMIGAIKNTLIFFNTNT